MSSRPDYIRQTQLDLQERIENGVFNSEEEDHLELLAIIEEVSSLLQRQAENPIFTEENQRLLKQSVQKSLRLLNLIRRKEYSSFSFKDILTTLILSLGNLRRNNSLVRGLGKINSSFDYLGKQLKSPVARSSPVARKNPVIINNYTSGQRSFGEQMLVNSLLPTQRQIHYHYPYSSSGPKTFWEALVPLGYILGATALVGGVVGGIYYAVNRFNDWRQRKIIPNNIGIYIEHGEDAGGIVGATNALIDDDGNILEDHRRRPLYNLRQSDGIYFDSQGKPVIINWNGQNSALIIRDGLVSSLEELTASLDGDYYLPSGTKYRQRTPN